jgi:hypothetical protein
MQCALHIHTWVCATAAASFFMHFIKPFIRCLSSCLMIHAVLCHLFTGAWQNEVLRYHGSLMPCPVKIRLRSVLCSQQCLRCKDHLRLHSHLTFQHVISLIPDPLFNEVPALSRLKHAFCPANMPADSEFNPPILNMNPSPCCLADCMRNFHWRKNKQELSRSQKLATPNNPCLVHSTEGTELLNCSSCLQKLDMGLDGTCLVNSFIPVL